MSRHMSKGLMLRGLGPEWLRQDEQSVLEAAGLTVARKGMRVVGISIGTSAYERRFIGDFTRGEAVALVHAPAPLGDAQASLQIRRPSVAPKSCFLLRTCLSK